MNCLLTPVPCLFIGIPISQCVLAKECFGRFYMKEMCRAEVFPVTLMPFFFSKEYFPLVNAACLLPAFFLASRKFYLF